MDDVLQRLVQGFPPDWASEWGEDAEGVFVAFGIGEATQRLRWIPPGTFVMGSPADEPERYEDEGPQHDVTIAEGFWLFDTPCTQALWTAVMGDNPSRFKSPDRPVEQVTWGDVLRFLKGVNARVVGLDLRLPSEAEWEYACRAGTTTALYTGDIAIIGERNAPALHPVAWYGGNSGVDFDLKDGEDIAAWPDKQYYHGRAGTHPVAQKIPNGWGLHDMLGNVWEWCEDHWHDSYDGAPADGHAWVRAAGAGKSRVTRGGSWVGAAHSLRCACRFAYDPRDASFYLGFRCARGRSAAGAGPAG